MWQGEPVDVVVPQPDPLVRLLAANPPDAATFLPSLEVIDICQSKSAAATIWNNQGLRSPALSVYDPYPDTLHLAADRFGLPFWLRANHGAGANKAIKVTSVGEAFHWIRFWETRGVDVSWIAEEFCPGRDLAWSSVWYRGELVTSFLRERVEYLYPHLSPEGLTGTPTIARIIRDPEVSDVAADAVEVVDPQPHGIYSVDLKEDSLGIARPTEINAGRGFTTFGLWALAGGVNFLDLVVNLAVGNYDGPVPSGLVEGLTLSRHIDCGHVFTEAPVYA